MESGSDICSTGQVFTDTMLTIQRQQERNSN